MKKHFVCKNRIGLNGICGSGIMYKGKGRYPEFCESCRKPRDNFKRQQRRDKKQTPDMIAKLLSKVSEGDNKTVLKLSHLFEKVERIRDETLKESHINKMKTDLEKLRKLISLYPLNKTLRKVEERIRWKLEEAEKTPAKEFKTMAFSQIDPTLIKNLNKRKRKMRLKKKKS
jgi:hypothetical protein